MDRLGKYKLLKELPGNAVAECYLARQVDIKKYERLVQIQRLRPELAQDKALREVFLAGGQRAMRFRHPNILRVFHVGEEEQSYFWVVEQIQGHHLAELQEKAAQMGQRLPYSLISYIMVRLCSALYHVHNLPVADDAALPLIHGNLSPEYVFLSDEGDVRLAGFGIAQVMYHSATRQLLSYIGNSSYRSPEHCRGEELDVRSDLFAAGIILYELLCQRRLFRRNNEQATQKAILSDPIPPPSAVIDDVPDELEVIVLRALAREKEKRQLHASQLQEELEQAIRRHNWQVGRDEAAEYLSTIFPEARSEEHVAAGSDPALFNTSLFQEDEDSESGADPFTIAAGPTERTVKMARVAPRTAPANVPSTSANDVSAFEGTYVGPQADGSLVDAARLDEVFKDVVDRPSSSDPRTDPSETIILDDEELFAIEPSALKGDPTVPDVEYRQAYGLTETKETLSARPAAPPVPAPAPAPLPTMTGGPPAGPLLATVQEIPVSAQRLSGTEEQLASSRSSSRARLYWGIGAGLTLLLIIIGGVYWWNIEARSSELQIEIISDPPGATLYLNGQKHYSPTPLTLRGLQRGREYHLILVLHGYVAWEKRFQLTAESSIQRIEAQLHQLGMGTQPAMVELKVNEVGAKVYIDGELKGTTPLAEQNISSGVRHELMVRKAGFQEEMLQVGPLLPGEQRQIPILLKLKRPGAVKRKHRPHYRTHPKVKKSRAFPSKKQRSQREKKGITVPRALPRSKKNKEAKIGERLP